MSKDTKKTRFYRYLKPDWSASLYYKNLKRLCEAQGLNYTEVHRRVLRLKNEEGEPRGYWVSNQEEKFGSVYLHYFEE